jgi:gas vesicle protein
MLSLAKHISEYYTRAKENKRKQQEQDLKDTLAKLEDDEEPEEQQVEEEIVNQPDPKNCFKQTGKYL